MSERLIRLFFALPLAADLRPAVAGVQDRLREAGRRVKWVEPENLHYTLKFLGEMPESALPRLRAVAAEVARRHSAFEVAISGVGAFPRPSEARVVWAGCRAGAEQMSALAADLDRALSDAKLAQPEARPFKPHLTLGRNKAEGPTPQLAEAISATADPEVGTMAATGFALMQSDLRREGPVYTELAWFSLSEP